MHVLWVESPSGGVNCVIVKRACAMVDSVGVNCVMVNRACAMGRVPKWWCYLCNGKTCMCYGRVPQCWC